MPANSENNTETLQFRAGQDLRVGLSGAAVEYLNALLRVLGDQVLTKVERDYVKSIARLHGLSKQERLDLHTLFLEQMALELSVDDASAQTRKSQLVRLSRQLGLEPDAALKAMQTADCKIEQIVAEWIGEAKEVAESTDTSQSRFLKPVALFASWGKGVVKAGSRVGATLRNVTKLKSARYDFRCDKCEKVTSHSLDVGKDFPAYEWLNILWNARTLSVPGYAVNAAILAASDKKLLQATGNSLLPNVYCSVCRNQASMWISATIVISVLKGNQQGSYEAT